MRWLWVILGVAVAGLALTNPKVEHLRTMMRAQDSIALELVSRLPIERTSYGLFSRFEIQYLIGSRVCWGAAFVVFVCPEPRKEEPRKDAPGGGRRGDTPQAG